MLMKPAHAFQRLAVVVLSLAASCAAWAQADPPGRVGRLAELQGDVSIYDNAQGQWIPAVRNRPLTDGDRVSTAGDGRAEMQVGSTTLRLGEGSELEVLQLDDQHLSFQLHSGELALRTRSSEVAAETDIVTAEAVLRPQRSGHFRIDRVDDTTYASSWRGELRVAPPDGGADEAFVIDNGRRAEIWRDASSNRLRHEWSQAPDDDFAAWAQRADEDDERSVSNRYVSPEMTGADDLDRNGAWEQSSDYGAVWIPRVVPVGWAPYRYGHWTWIAPWGWTWVDDAPWGFAPFHYGRWVNWRGRWCWTPGGYVARPAYAPALVAWVGGPGLGISISVGGPTVGWLPLAPRDVYRPWYHASPRYVARINHRPPNYRLPPRPAGRPMAYGNQAVAGALTVVSRDVLEHRRPVAHALIDEHQRPDRAHGKPFEAAPPPPRPNAPRVGPMPPRGRPLLPADANHRPAVHPGTRPEAPLQSRPEARPEPLPQARPPEHAAPAPSARPEGRHERPEARPQPRPAIGPVPHVSQEESQPRTRPEPRPNARPEAPREPRPDARPEGPREPRPSTRPEARPTPRPEPRAPGTGGAQGGHNPAPPDVVQHHAPPAPRAPEVGPRPPPQPQSRREAPQPQPRPPSERPQPQAERAPQRPEPQKQIPESRGGDRGGDRDGRPQREQQR